MKTVIDFSSIFLHFKILFFGNVKKKVRVGGFELGSVGEPETHLFFFLALGTDVLKFW